MKIQILIDNKNSWYVPFAFRLQKKLRNKVDSNIKIIDPSAASINKFNKYFAKPKNESYQSISYKNVKFFVTSEKDKFSKKVKIWLEINKEITLVNLGSNV